LRMPVFFSQVSTSFHHVIKPVSERIILLSTSTLS
jgi:hypothetical protein